MARDLSQLSTTPASNDATGGFKTGMRPSSVKNAGWADESILAQLFNKLPVGGGAANAQTLTNPVPLTTLTDGLTVFMLPGFANTGPATFSPDGLTAESVFANGAALAGGELQTTVPAILKYRLSVTAWELINPAPPGRNFFVDPCCRVAQGDPTTTLTTAYKFGSVDMVSCKATGTAVSAGTIIQNTSGTVAAAATPNSVQISGATITGTGKVFIRRWVESRDSQALNGQTVMFSVKCRQDTGGSINAFLTLNKFQSQDSAGTPTLLATGSTASVSTATDTTITLAYTFGASDGANGFELILEMDCGAVTTKNFYATDWQACIGTLSQRCIVPRVEDDFQAGRRYFLVAGLGIMGEAINGIGTIKFWVMFPVPMLAVPAAANITGTITVRNGANAASTTSGSPSSVSGDKNGLTLILGAVTANPASGNACAIDTASALSFDCRP